MKLNPLPWFKEWLSQPDEFWLALNNVTETVEEQLHNANKEKINNLNLKEAEKLADMLYGAKS